jgi:uncharacterized protein DUF6152
MGAYGSIRPHREGRMNKVATFVLVGWLVLALAPQTFAHHSAAAFDTQKEVRATGTVTTFAFRNPHVYLVLQVKKPDGSTGSLEVEAGAASVLNPLGFTKTSLAVGDTVTIVGNPARAKPDALMLGKDLYKQDGAYYPLFIGSRSVYSSSSASATTIAGTWFSPFSEFNAYGAAVRTWPLTEAGKAAMASFDPKATAQKDCIPVGVPNLMFYPVADTITVERDRVVMSVDWMDSRRTIFLDGRKHPPATETFLHGHSVGHWEGDTLVVETTNFKEHPLGLSTAGLPGSTRKRVIERFRLGDGGKVLLYSGIVEDPVYLTRPAEWSGQWQYRPNMPHSNEKCDLTVAHKYLGDFK